MVGAMALKQGDGGAATLYINHAPTDLTISSICFFVHFTGRMLFLWHARLSPSLRAAFSREEAWREATQKRHCERSEAIQI